MTRVKTAGNFFADTNDMLTRVASLEQMVTTLGPQDQGSSFTAPSIQKAVASSAYDGTNPALPNGSTQLYAAASKPIQLTYTPTRNAWWFVYAQAQLIVATSTTANQSYAAYITLNNADVDGESQSVAWTSTPITSAGVQTLLWTGSTWRLFALQGASPPNTAPVTYTASLFGLNSNNNPAATYARTASYTFMWAAALPRQH